VPNVLVVDDERDLVSLLDFNLRQAGYETTLAYGGEEALSAARARPPHLVLLDLMLPDIYGTEVCRQLKADPRTRSVPVVMLTARGSEVDRVVGFELGADDYVVKPFSIRELILRVGAVLRRAGALSSQGHVPATDIGAIRVDPDAHKAWARGNPLVLTPVEFRLLSTLVSRAGRVQSRERLLADVWGAGGESETRTVDTHVKRIRRKLGPEGERIETVRGVGYRFRDPGDDAPSGTH
jgi:two-component system phosphate regulon response regulator PhoB